MYNEREIANICLNCKNWKELSIVITIFDETRSDYAVEVSFNYFRIMQERKFQLIGR